MLNGHELGDGLAGLADDHFLARLHLRHQPRKMRLRPLHIGDFNAENLLTRLGLVNLFSPENFGFNLLSSISKFDLRN